MKIMLSLIFVAVIILNTAACDIKTSLTETSISDNCEEKSKDQNPDLYHPQSKDAEKILDVPALCQYPELPTGCEAVCAAMVLHYYDVNITAQEFASDWLTCSEEFYSSNGKQYGPDPNKVFAGNPFSKNAYGCFAGPIAQAINHNCISCTAEIITGYSLEQLCKEYIDRNSPLLVWATMGMKESSKGNFWLFEDGTDFTWISGEHCLVLIGYNTYYYFLNDPISGSTVAYQKKIVEKRFAELGSQALYISSQKP